MESSTATMESSSSATQPIAAQVENDDEDHYTSSPFEDELDGFSPRPETYLSDKDTKKKMVDVTGDPYYLPWTKKKPAIGPKTFKHRTRRYIYKTDESSDSETEDFFRVTIKPGVGPTSWRQRHECDSREELRDYWMDRFDGFKASNKRTLHGYPKTFACAHCGKPFATLTLYEEHVDNDILREEVCECCTFTLKLPLCYAPHNRRLRSTWSRYCSLCVFHSCTEHCMRKHMKYEHGEDSPKKVMKLRGYRPYKALTTRF